MNANALTAPTYSPQKKLETLFLLCVSVDSGQQIKILNRKDRKGRGEEIG
jgi:hypothetical protein